MSKIKSGLQFATKGTGYQLMPKVMQDLLDGKTLNAAIEDGSITDLGDEGGNLFHQYDNAEDASCAIINGYRVPCSRKLNQTEGEELKGVLGDLCFGAGISPETLDGKPNPNAGKAWFNIGMPKSVATTADETINIGDKAFIGA